MSFLIGYGSLIHPDETNRHAFEVTSRVPVRVLGFERLFNQRSCNRVGEGDKLSVLNVQKKENCWINAILLGGFSEKYHGEIDEREGGYERIKVPKNHILPYGNDIVKNDAFIYVGLDYMKCEDMLPIDRYLDLCMRGAKCYGEEFLKDFLTTTWVRGGVRLDDYVTKFASFKNGDAL